MREQTYRRYLLLILLSIFAFSGMDGLALGLVLQDIKRDLNLSDTQLGTLSGIAFAVFYSVMGIPIARWADRGNRVVIISLCLTAWSVMVVLCGLVTSFPLLLLIRVGVAVGESGCNPTSQSLIADYFKPAELPRALGIYMVGSAGSIAFGYFVAGWVDQFYGWRMTFIVLGVPGPLLALLAWRTLREPRLVSLQREGGKESRRSSSAPQPTLKEVSAVLWSNQTFVHLLLAFAVASFFANGIVTWQAAFFSRVYGLNPGELGTWFAVIYGIGGTTGVYIGGAWATRHAGRNESFQLRVMGLMYCAFAVISTCVYLCHNPYLALGLLGVAALGGSTVGAPLFATVQTLVPERMRATAIAIVYLFSNLIGIGLGPLVSGVLSDALQPLVGVQSLRYALLLLSPGYIWAGWHLWKASRSVRRDLDAVRQELPTLKGGGMMVNPL